MDIAIADFIFSNALPISLAECTKFQHSYLPPFWKKMTSNLLDGLYQSAYSKQIESMLKQSKIFDVTLFQDGATIKKNFLAWSPNNPCALLEIADCGLITQTNPMMRMSMVTQTMKIMRKKLIVVLN
jgi:hypothetical protein